MYRVFAKKLFGVKYERLGKALLIWLLVFYGLYLAGYRVRIAPLILYLMISSFSAGVMWQALASGDSVDNMQNLLMLPFGEKHFIFSYVAVLGIYTIFTKTAGLMAVALAVCSWSGKEILTSVLCAVNAILMSACMYAESRRRSEEPVSICMDPAVFCKFWRRKNCAASGREWRSKGNPASGRLLGKPVRKILSVVWVCAVVADMVLLWDQAFFVPLLTGNILLAVLLLCGADAYAFYAPAGGKSRFVRGGRRALVWRYLFRYLSAHLNYLLNTGVIWIVACVLPVFFSQMGGMGMSVMPIGFAILSLNTPICILLSCDPDLEQAVRFLPGQKKAFCVPYCLFIFLCNMAANTIFLVSWHLTAGGLCADGMAAGGFRSWGAAAEVNVVLTAVFFALLSAVGSVLMEWFYPVRGWKIESDLWHHPRKYIVPAIMLLLAGILGGVK